MSALSFDFDHPALHRPSDFSEVAQFLATEPRFVEQEAALGKLKVKESKVLPDSLYDWLADASTVPIIPEAPVNIVAMATLIRAAAAERSTIE